MREQEHLAEFDCALVEGVPGGGPSSLEQPGHHQVLYPNLLVLRADCAVWEAMM